MSAPYRAKVGFVSGSAHWGSHYDRLLALVPSEVSLEIKPLGREARSQYNLAGTGDEQVERAREVAKESGWQAMACTGAPTQMQNPGYLDKMRAALDIPVTTAVEASGHALRALGIRKALLLTPFRRYMNDMIGQYLAGLGVEPLLADRDFQEVEEAARLGPDEVYSFALSAFRSTSGAEAIYFQGAVLDPVPVLDRLESELGVPAVASNPAMLWHTLSMIGQRYSVSGGGRLLRDWPTLVAARG